MDPLSAFALSCNVFQVIELGITVAQYCLDLRKSDNAFKLLEEDSTRLADTSEKLQVSIRKAADSTTSSETDRALLEASKACYVAVTALNGEVRKFRVPDEGKGRKRQIFMVAVKSSFASTKISKLENDLKRQRDELDTCILADLRSRGVATEHRLEELSGIEKANQRLLADLNTGQANLAQLTAQEGLQIRDHVTKEVLRLQEDIGSAENRNNLDRVLDSLFFVEMDVRREEIRDAHMKTFEWIFGKGNGSSQDRNDFCEWLQHDRGIFWMSGKAGSGKSTLMCFLLEHKRTVETLQKWSNGKVIMPSFFFWKLGEEPLQKNILGIQRSLLYQFLRHFPNLVTVVAPADSQRLAAWTDKRLRTALLSLLKQVTQSNYCCIFVDALDEFEGNIGDLNQLLRELTQFENVKVCVSSRPLNQFELEFAASKKLRLHELTKSDMNMYLMDSFHEQVSQHRISALTEDELQLLAAATLSKASGVFLWVHLACSSICEGIASEDTYTQLQARLEAMPPELEELFAHMLHRIGTLYRKEAVRYFRLLLVNEKKKSMTPWPLTMLSIAFIELGLPGDFVSGDFSPSHILERCRILEIRVRTRTAGLLELGNPRTAHTAGDERALEQCDTSHTSLRFIHRTAEEFIRNSSQIIAREVAEDKGWSPTVALAKAHLSRVVHLPGALTSSLECGLASDPKRTMFYLQRAEFDTQTAQTASLANLISTLTAYAQELVGKDAKNALISKSSIPWFMLLSEEDPGESLFSETRGELQWHYHAGNTAGVCAAYGLTCSAQKCLAKQPGDASYLLACTMETVQLGGVNSMHAPLGKGLGPIWERWDWISNLLQAGADPNMVNPVSTHWLGPAERQDDRDEHSGWWQKVDLDGLLVLNGNFDSGFITCTPWSLLLTKVMYKVDWMRHTRNLMRPSEFDDYLLAFLSHGATPWETVKKRVRCDLPRFYSLQPLNAHVITIRVDVEATILSLFEFTFPPSAEKDSSFRSLEEFGVPKRVEILSVACWFGDPNKPNISYSSRYQIELEVDSCDSHPCLKCMYRHSYWDNTSNAEVYGNRRLKPYCDKTKAFFERVGKTIEAGIPKQLEENSQLSKEQCEQSLADGTWPQLPEASPYLIKVPVLAAEVQ